MNSDHFHQGLHWSCGSVDKRLQNIEKALQAADELATAAKTHLRYVFAVNANVSLDGMDTALVAYEKVRGMK